MATVIKRDNDGHKYEIPKELAAEFDLLFDHYILQTRGTEAYWDAEANFNNKFYEYMIG